MERIVYVFRALASRPRMHILRSLVEEEELTVSAIGRRTGLVMNSLCSHLRVLATGGLVWRRRSGGSVFYRLAEEPASLVTQSTLGVVRRAFAGQRAAGRSRASQNSTLDAVEEGLFATFTAFTHPRRLQILRHLDAYGQTCPEVVSEALSMSLAAAARHLGKLWRRGLVVKRASTRGASYEIAEDMPSAAVQLLNAVLADMDRAGR